MTHKKIDQNQQEIVAALRRRASCFSTASLGRGIPDVVAGFLGKTYLIEIKGRKGQLSIVQKAWHRHWEGNPVIILRSVADVDAFFVRCEEDE
jgi:Holliday junction resolvase